MKSKIVSIITISSVVLVAFLTSLAVILIGTKNVSHSYVKLEINPKVEFVCDKHEKVMSLKPLNEEGEVVVSGIDFKGKEIEDALNLFLNLSAKLGYVKLSDDDFNVIKLTVVSGLTQSLDVHVYETANKWLCKNEILGVIVENQNDMEMVREAKSYGISANKLALIKSVINSNPSLSVEQLKNKHEDELIDLINSFHKSYEKNNENMVLESLEIKNNLLLENEEKFNEYINSVTPKNAGKFIQKLRELNQKEQTKIELAYSKYAK